MHWAHGSRKKKIYESFFKSRFYQIIIKPRIFITYILLGSFIPIFWTFWYLLNSRRSSCFMDNREKKAVYINVSLLIESSIQINRLRYSRFQSIWTKDHGTSFGGHSNVTLWRNKKHDHVTLDKNMFCIYVVSIFSLSECASVYIKRPFQDL